MVDSPSLSSPNPTLLLLSFGSTHPSVLFPFRAVPCAARSASALLPVLPFLCAPSFFSPIASLPFFPVHPPLSPRLVPDSKCLDGFAPVTARGVRRAKSRPAVEEHHTLEQNKPESLPLAPISIVSCLLTCTCLYLLQIPTLISARSLESITRTGLTSYVSENSERSEISSPALYLHQAKFSTTTRRQFKLFSHLPVMKVIVAAWTRRPQRRS